MKIVWREIVRAGKDVVVAAIDTENLDLGIDTIWDESSTSADRELLIEDTLSNDDNNSDTDDSDEETDDEIPSVTTTDGAFNLAELYFSVDTYRRLLENRQMWERLLDPTNLFFGTLSESDLRQFCLFYIEARRTIDKELVPGAIVEVSTRLGNLFYDFAMSIDLISKVIVYVKFNDAIPKPDFSSAGTNIGRDRPELTFCADNDLTEYYVILAITVICKMLCPIWGDLIERTTGDTDNMFKETLSLRVIEPLLSCPDIRPVYEKIHNIITNIVTTEMKHAHPNGSFTASMGGVSNDKYCHVITAQVIVKRLVTVDLYKTDPDGNIVIWIHTCAQRAFTSLKQTLNAHCQIVPRNDVSNNPDWGDEHSISALEYSSHTTEVTADIPVLIRFIIMQGISKFRKQYQVSDLEFQSTMNHYKLNPVQVTIFNKVFIALFFGNSIGGAQGLKYLDRPLFTELVAIVQLYISQQYEAPSVVHLLTANSPEDIRPVIKLSTMNGRIATNTRNSPDFHLCEKVLPDIINGIGVGSVLKRLQDFIINHHHYINTASMVNANLDDPATQFVQDKLLEYDENVMQNCCAIILDIIDPARVRRSSDSLLRTERLL